MSKQYLTTHTIDDAHTTDIFSLAVTPIQIISASGASSIKIYSTTEPDFPLVQTLERAHKLGCHHVATSRGGKKFASIGFGGEVKLWSLGENERWIEEDGKRDGLLEGKNKAGQLWAIALAEDGRFLATTTHDGRIKVFDLLGEESDIIEYETKGSFGMCLDISFDGQFTASGHENGGIYVFANHSSRMTHSLPSLVKPVRSVAFSPGGKLLAAAGDSRIIALFDVISGDQVGNLTGHGAWIMSLDWSNTGEYLLSGGFDGKAKVWSIDTKTCVATQTETDKSLWSVKWLPKTGRTENFATGGANRSISFYREATGS
ncbi:MAG: hypothetical protein M4579_005260 [Chaenotheca gracillima]|nr:MAG: hypothetical protein M4579_005260 [Chaenotheca gracillima]